MRLPLLAVVGLMACFAAVTIKAGELSSSPNNNIALDPAVAYWAKLAKDGDKFSQSKLARKYERGDGLSQDYSQAAYWYQKAAEQDMKKAQQRLGKLYEDGMGVPQDFKLATYWYRKSAQNNYYLGLANLARMYELGKGVRRNTKKALDLYQKSINLEPSGPSWIEESFSRLIAKQQCSLKAQATLFDNEILCASRDDLHQAIAKAGGIKINAQKNAWYDRYNSADLLANSSELQMAYTLDGKFALAQYVFPSQGEPHQVSQIRSMVQNRYGLPDVSRGSPRRGKVSYVWKLEDGVEIRVSRGWPDTTTYMTFKNPQTYKKMAAEITAYREKNH